MSAIYPNSGRPSSEKNWHAISLCRNIVDGQFCNTPIDISSRLCDECRKRGHAKSCPSPQQKCTCGFSRLFWAEVDAWSEAQKAKSGMELSAEHLLKGRENLCPAGVSNSRRDEGMASALNCVPLNERKA